MWVQFSLTGEGGVAQGSSDFMEFPLLLLFFSSRTCCCSQRPTALPFFSLELWSLPPLPISVCPAQFPLVSPEVPCPRRKPGGGGQALPAFTDTLLHPLLSSTWVLTPSRCCGNCRFVLTHRHFGHICATSPSFVPKVAHQFLFCYLVTLPVVGVDWEIQKLFHHHGHHLPKSILPFQ